MINFSSLNDRQLAAVTAPSGPVKVIAGAGSGKTRVLTNRAAYLIDKGADPYHILALTFTNKAADEMKRRIFDMVRCERMWVGTFHSVCVKILRYEAAQIGYTSNFSIYDETDVATLIKNLMKENGLEADVYKPRDLRTQISRAKNNGIDPEEMFEKAKYYIEEKTAEVYAQYLKRMKANNAFDFDDLLLKVRDLLKNEEVRKKYATRFEHVLVDEYQDTNIVQYEILRALSSVHGNLFVVGDDDQSIYAFRGADIRNIREFERDFPGAATIYLEQNYRSQPRILDVANSIIKNNTDRSDKTLYSELPVGELPCELCFDNERAEADHIGGEIARLVSLGVRKSDIAVMYRTNAQSRVLESQMKYLGVPYRVYGGMSFYQREEIKDLSAYITLCVNPASDVSLMRIINKPKRKIGETTIAKIAEAAGEHAFTMLQVCRKADEYLPKQAELLKSFAALIDDMSAFKGTLSGHAAYIAEKSGLLASLDANGTIEAMARMENIEEFINGALEFEKQYPDATLADFIADNALISDVPSADEDETVSLLTLHSAKGLEFGYVFLAGVQQGLLPHAMSVDKKDVEEERRLCYVGITRAKLKLTITWSKTRTMFGGASGTQAFTRSQFLAEVPKEEMNIRAKDSAHAAAFKLPESPTVFRKFERAEVPMAKKTPDVCVGDHVAHAKFGEGVVLKLMGQGTEKVAVVKFAEGEKKMFLAFAPLNVI